MFVLTQLQDTVAIKASSKDKNIAVLDKLKIKYTGKFIEKLGLSLFVNQIIEILDFEIESELLISNVIFNVVFYRFYPEEIIFAKITKQEEEKLLFEDELGNIYEVCAQDLFENCEYENGDIDGRWVWNYKGNQLPFITGDMVRIKIKGLKEDSNIIEASMNDQGLGHIDWWD